MGTVDQFQIGWKKEATYGTRVVPDHFGEVRSESMQADQRYFVSQQLGSGSTFVRGSRRLPTTQDAGGSIVMEVPNKGFGFWLDLLHNNTVTPVQQAATAAYLQTHNIGLTSAPKSATVQIAKPSTDGVARPFDYTGCMVTSMGFGWAVDDALVATIALDAQKEDTSQTLATKSIPSGLASFVFTGGALKIAGSTVADVMDGSLTIAIPRSTDFYPLGTTGLKSTPLTNGINTASGTATVRFTDLTHYNRYKNNTKPSLELSFTGANIASTYYENIDILCNQVGFTGETPTVDSPDVLTHAIPFDVLYDGTNAPVIITYTSTDITL